MRKNAYTHLTYEEKCQISGYLERSFSVSRIASYLNRHKSTIYRELKRGRKPAMLKAKYSARHSAQNYKKQRAKNAKPIKYSRIGL